MGLWYNTEKRQRAERKRETEDGRVGEKEEEGFSIQDRRVILTVGNTLILDLEVLVSPWAGVREDI